MSLNSHDLPNTISVAKGVRLAASLTTQDHVIIDGTFEGDLTCSHLYVGPSGVVTGTVTVKSAEILGRVSNQLSVETLLVLRSSGRVEGRFSYGEFEVEKGGVLSGSVETSGTRSEPSAIPSTSKALAAVEPTPRAKAKASPHARTLTLTKVQGATSQALRKGKR